MQSITIKGRSLSDLVKTTGKTVKQIQAVCRSNVWEVSYIESRVVGVVAFGHCHFKECCKSFGLEWQSCRYISTVNDVLDSTAMKVIIHPTAISRRDYNDIIEKVEAV